MSKILAQPALFACLHFATPSLASQTGSNEGPRLTEATPCKRRVPLDVNDVEQTLATATVSPEAIPVGEGETRPGARLKVDGDDSLLVVWRDLKGRSVDELRLNGRASSWCLPNGDVSLGSSLKTLEKLNGRAFSLSGFAWDYGGTVNSWNDGALASAWKPATIILRLEPPHPGPKGVDLSRVMIGDLAIPSHDTVMQAIDPRVYEIIVRLEEKAQGGNKGAGNGTNVGTGSKLK